jgi:hypothetical protein
MNFRIGSDGGLSLTFHSRTVGANGWVNSYLVTAEAPGFSASVEVDNAPYGSSPSEFFAEVASAWAGWQGAKRWQALEGEYELSATTDSTGHITIVARLNAAIYPPTWEGMVAVMVEAGAVEALAARAKEFFGPAPIRADVSS